MVHHAPSTSNGRASTQNTEAQCFSTTIFTGSVRIVTMAGKISTMKPSMAKFLHCVRTACILRTQRLGYSPKNTCHLSSSTAKQQSPHENNENAFKGLQGRQTSTCRPTHLHMHRFINV